MSWTKEELIEGIRCEKCYPRAFGQMVNDEADNLYLYKDLGGNTRCFCKKHMGFCGEGYKTPQFGARLKSEILNDALQKINEQEVKNE